VAKDESFDVVSKADMQEFGNAINQAQKELETRFDFKGSKSSIDWSNEVLTVVSDDEFKLGNVLDIVQTKLLKRGVSLKHLDYGKLEGASQGTIRQVIKVKQGIEQDVTKQIIKVIKDSKIKVQASVQGDSVRVSGKNRDDLQAVIQLLKQQDLSCDLQFNNFR